MKTKMKIINTKKELVALAKELGVRDDWYEPDEQEVDATVHGRSFDNAGFWPAGEFGTNSILEKHVIIKKEGKPVGAINLATLFAIACAE
jgi:hypothetical protein